MNHFAKITTWARSQKTTVIALGLCVFVRTTFANQYVVPSGSMEPTIAIGDRILVNRAAYDLKLPFSNVILKRLGEPERGQVVVFESPGKPGLVLVKRLIALPGDEVEIRDGFVFLNGSATAETTALVPEYRERLGSRLHRVQRLPELFRPEHYRFRVPAGHYFMMGDNRDNSADGRVFGFVRRELLIGEATRVLFSLDLAKPLGDAVAWERFGRELE